MERDQRVANASLGALIVLQGVMLFALYTKTPPHPPEVVAPFGIAPFLGASLALAVAALMLGSVETRAGRVACGLAGVAALVSYGPQKYFDVQFGLIWPSVVLGQIAVVGIGIAAVRGLAGART